MPRTVITVQHRAPLDPSQHQALQDLVSALLGTKLGDVAVTSDEADPEEQVVDRFTMTFLTQAIEVSVVHDGLLFSPPVQPQTCGAFSRIRLANNPPATIAARVAVVEMDFPVGRRYLLRALLRGTPNFYTGPSNNVELAAPDGTSHTEHEACVLDGSPNCTVIEPGPR